MSLLSNIQVMTITRAVVLATQFTHVISDHELGVVMDVGGRFRRNGRAAFVTANEWPVIEMALGAMEAVRRDRAAASQTNTAAEDAAGVRVGSSQPAA